MTHLQLGDGLDRYFERLSFILGSLDVDLTHLQPAVQTAETALQTASLSLDAATNAETRARAGRARTFRKVVKAIDALAADETAFKKKPAGAKHQPIVKESPSWYARLSEDERSTVIPEIVNATKARGFPAPLKESGGYLAEAWAGYEKRDKALEQCSKSVEVARVALSLERQNVLTTLTILEGQLLQATEGDREEAESILEEPRRGGKKGGTKAGKDGEKKEGEKKDGAKAEGEKTDGEKSEVAAKTTEAFDPATGAGGKKTE